MWTRAGAGQSAAYDNAAAVADSAELAARRRADSAQLLNERTDAVVQSYGPAERQRITLLPSSDRTAPWLVFIHGGYWQWNSADEFACVTTGVAAHGWSAALPGYTLSPEVKIPRIVKQVGQALDRIAELRREWGHSGKLILCGWSAGAQLAAMNLGHASVDAALMISGVYDLAPLLQTSLNAALGLTTAEVETCSPLRIAPVPKPTVIAWGGMDLPALQQQSHSYLEHLLSHGVPANRLILLRANHFTILHALQNPEGLLTRAVIDANTK